MLRAAFRSHTKAPDARCPSNSLCESAVISTENHPSRRLDSGSHPVPRPSIIRRVSPLIRVYRKVRSKHMSMKFESVRMCAPANVLPMWASLAKVSDYLTQRVHQCCVRKFSAGHCFKQQSEKLTNIFERQQQLCYCPGLWYATCKILNIITL